MGEAHNILSSDGVVEAHQVPYVGKHPAHYALFFLVVYKMVMLEKRKRKSRGKEPVFKKQ